MTIKKSRAQKTNKILTSRKLSDFEKLQKFCATFPEGKNSSSAGKSYKQAVNFLKKVSEKDE